VAGSCQHGNERLGPIKYGEFLDRVSEEGFCSMELVT
jgi:hypothetical protein